MSDKKNIQTRKRIRHLGPSVAFLILALPHSPLLLLILSAVPVSTGGRHCRGGGGIAVAVAALALPLCGAHQRRRGRGRRGHRSPIRLSVPCPTLMRQSEARSPTYPSLVSSVRRLAPFLPFFLMSECPITLVSAPSFLSGRRRTAATATSFLPNENRRTTPTFSAVELSLGHFGHFKGIRAISNFFSPVGYSCLRWEPVLIQERVRRVRPAFHTFILFEDKFLSPFE